jgi:8-oxo-dGTP pyrophosphatase MutT (NUDIX family)
MNMDDTNELVDILMPPLFIKSGTVKPRTQAWQDGNWIGTFTMFVVQERPRPAIIYQIRGPEKSWEPGKLDVTVGGHYQAGESLHDGLREAEEELGKRYRPTQLTFVGRKLYVGPDQLGRERRNVVEIGLLIDNDPLPSFKLQKEEVYALCLCPIDELVKVHSNPTYSFKTQALTNGGKTQAITVRKHSFPENYDDFHFKMTLLAQRFLNGERNIIY